MIYFTYKSYWSIMTMMALSFITLIIYKVIFISYFFVCFIIIIIFNKIIRIGIIWLFYWYPSILFYSIYNWLFQFCKRIYNFLDNKCIAMNCWNFKFILEFINLKKNRILRVKLRYVFLIKLNEFVPLYYFSIYVKL